MVSSTHLTQTRHGCWGVSRKPDHTPASTSQNPSRKGFGQAAAATELRKVTRSYAGVTPILRETFLCDAFAHMKSRESYAKLRGVTLDVASTRAERPI